MGTMVEEKPFELTASLEDYLEAIKELIDADGHGHAHTSEIARRLKVKMPSVTNALGVLRRHGYLNYDSNYPVTLTEKGVAAAERVIGRHRVLKAFLQEVLQLPAEAASATACRVEHVIDDQLIVRLNALNAVFADETCSAAIRQRLTQMLQHI
jgi:DtxR family Mn-dependent transcriptional regulator